MHSIAFYSGHQDGKCYVTRITSKHTKEGAMTAANANVLLREWVKVTKELMAK